MIVIDMSNGVTKAGCDQLIAILNVSSLHALNEERAAEGKPPLTEDQQIKLYGHVVSGANDERVQETGQ